MSRYRVNVTTRCEMVVAVDADSIAEAKRVARSGAWEPLTDWQPLDYGAIAAGWAEPAEPAEPAHRER